MSSSDNAIEIKDLVISYKEEKSFSIKNILHRKKAQYFTAVNGVSFDVKKGEIVGIIGRNGSGKSTLLNSVAGIFAPDSGSINLNGNSVSLLSIGVGFQRSLSGRANIILCGLLLGFEEKFIREKMDEIIEFSELGKFIDKPVRTYSSGMYSKLAFSITAMLETDIILVDEVLSVGDEHFRKKSSRKMKELISHEDRTVLIVSHNMNTLTELCTKIVWMHDGEIKMMGNPSDVLPLYDEFMK